jgi:hypothetical protein
MSAPRKIEAIVIIPKSELADLKIAEESKLVMYGRY